MSLFNIFAPTSTSETSQTLHNTATQPIPETQQLDEPTEDRVLSSPLSFRTTPKSAQPLKDTPRKRGRPKKIVLSAQPPLEKATRGRGRPKKIQLSPQSSKATMARNRVSAKIDESRLPFPELRGQDDEVEVTPIESDDEDEDDGNDGEFAARLLEAAHEAVKNNATAEPAKAKRGMPKGGWGKSKKTKNTPTPKIPRPRREAATESAKKTSANYALSSDPVADHSGAEVLASENAIPTNKAARGRKRASLGDEDAGFDEEEDAAPPPPKERGRPPKNRVEQPGESTSGRARLLQGFYEPIAVDADETPVTGELAAPKRKRGRPSNQASAESAEAEAAAAAGPSKGRGRASKKTAINGSESGLVDPHRLRIEGFAFHLSKVTKDGIKRDVIEAEFDFVPVQAGEYEEGYEIEKTENGGFRMSFRGDLRP